MSKKEESRPEHEVIFLRVPPALKEAIVAQVDGMNKARAVGEPEYTIAGWCVSCLAAVFEPIAVKSIEHNGSGRRGGKRARK
jgi:hypothetical protein